MRVLRCITTGRGTGELVGPRRSILRRRSGPLMALNLTPMIDVVFNLLIYFVVSTTFVRAEGFLASKMVRIGSGQLTQAIPVQPIRLSLFPRQNDSEGVRIQLENSATVPRDFEDLCQVLIGLRTAGIGFDATTPVVIHAADTIAWDHVVNAYNAVRRSGYESISFGKARPQR